MKLINKSFYSHLSLILLLTMLMALVARPITAGEYNVLNGLKEVKVAFTVTSGNRKTANVVLEVVHDI
jgi:hypothetical protein